MRIKRLEKINDKFLFQGGSVIEYKPNYIPEKEGL